MNKNKKYTFWQFIITVIFILSAVAFQQKNLLMAVTIQKYVIAPLNRLTVTFDKMPENIESSLSANKRIITINLNNTAFTNEKNSLTGDGIIRQVNLERKDGQTILTLNLTEQRGYTVARLPYSQTIVVEVFDWNKLNTAEEHYKMGLLSLIDGESELAKPDLQLATESDIADAAAFLGLIFLSEGKINSALQNFRFAEIKNTSINDSYAALSQIYNLKGNNELAEQYAKIYKQKTNATQVPTIAISAITELQDSISENLSYIDSVVKANENVAENLSDTNENASDTTQIENVAEKDTTQNQSIWTIENWLLTKYVIGIAVAVLMGIIYLYLKWRNKQLLLLQQKQAETATVSAAATANQKEKRAETKKDNPPAPAAKPDSKKAENDFGSLIGNKMAEIKAGATAENAAENNSTVGNKNSKNAAETKKRITDQIDIKKNAADLLNLIENMKADDVIKSDSVLKSELSIANRRAGTAAYQISKTPNSRSNISSDISKNIQKEHSANIELANRLANEQKKIKEEKLSGLSNTLEIESNKLSDVAQKLGIEKNSIETKQNLENLASKEEEFAKLSEKFGIKQQP